MKATDLMVGDWVSCNDLKRKVAAIGETVGFLDCNNQVYWAYEGFDRIDPIPLTEEILVKNGFERCDYNNQYFIINDVINLITPKWRGGTEYYACAWYQDEFSDLVQHIEICKCTYVYQLQHLLRLCRIEKELTI